FVASAIAGVLEVLRGAGVLADAPRALLLSARDEPSSINPALKRYLQLCEPDNAAWTARNQELAFLANALMVGCSVQVRPFTRRQAVDAVSATCNLGLDCWPPQWLTSSNPDLITVFQVGWTILHRDVLMVATDQLLHALDDLRLSDQELQFGL